MLNIIRIISKKQFYISKVLDIQLNNRKFYLHIKIFEIIMIINENKLMKII